jgi:hypothetical protein
VRTVVFVGPSLPLTEARAILPRAVYLPPARQADLLSAVETYQPDVIGLIDGAFGTASSVWHKEILYAIERGARVYGAASMGALRAIELASFGMLGIGEIYTSYASGALTDDDEVAVAHADATDGYRALTLPLVNLRATLNLARSDGRISAAEHDLLLKAAKSLYFADRRLDAILAAAVARGLEPAASRRVSTFLVKSYVDVKRRDAEQLLAAIRDLPQPLPAPPPPSFVLERSASFETMYASDRRVRHADVDVPLRDIATHAALHLTDFDDVHASALNRALVLVLADLLQVSVTDADVEAEAARFRSAHGIADDSALQEWLHSNALNRESFDLLMRELAVWRRLQRWLLARDRGIHHTRWVLDELRLRGTYPEVADAAARQQQLLAAWNTDAAEEVLPDDVDLAALADEHRQATGWRLDVPLDVWAEESGFEAPQDLAIALLRAAQARERLGAAARALGGASLTPEDRLAADSAAGASADCA